MAERTIGVLALQGAFAKHLDVLDRLGVRGKRVRRPSELEGCDGLIIPGGESSTMITLIESLDFSGPLRLFAQDKPVFGTCAGLILLANSQADKTTLPISCFNITVERNGYGRQYESFSAPIQLDKAVSGKPFPAVFIRAPRITEVGADVGVLASFNEEPVLVQQGHHLAATFHPELTADPSIHEYFLKL